MLKTYNLSSVICLVPCNHGHDQDREQTLPPLQKGPRAPPCPHLPSPGNQQSTLHHDPLPLLASSRILCKWTHMAHHLLCLAAFTHRKAFRIHSCWCVVFPFYGRAIFQCTGGPRLIHSPVGRHSFLVWGVKKKAAMNIYVQVLCGRNFSFSWVHALVTNFCITDPPSPLNLGAFRQ